MHRLPSGPLPFALAVAPDLVLALRVAGCVDDPGADEGSPTSDIPPLDSGSGDTADGTSSGGAEPGTADETRGGTGARASTVSAECPTPG